MKRKILVALLACVGHLVAFQGAQAFPDRPVRIVVPTPPGGPPDIMARLLIDKMGTALGQPVIVENRAGGAAGMIGAKAVLGAEPDGYTLLMGSTSTLMIAPLIYKNAGYEAKSFAPVAGLSESTELLTVNPAVAAHSVAELVQLAKSEPGVLHYGSAGVGSLPHLEGELLKARAHIDMVHVPYRGGGPALLGLLGGEVQIFFSTVTQMLPYVRDGIRHRLSDAVARALASAEVEQALAKIGAKAEPATPEQLTVYLAQQQLRWAKIVETTKMSAE